MLAKISISVVKCEFDYQKRIETSAVVDNELRGPLIGVPLMGGWGR